jgi:hypothetical protein
MSYVKRNIRKNDTLYTKTSAGGHKRQTITSQQCRGRGSDHPLIAGTKFTSCLLVFPTTRSASLIQPFKQDTALMCVCVKSSAIWPNSLFSPHFYTCLCFNKICTCSIYVLNWSLYVTWWWPFMVNTYNVQVEIKKWSFYHKFMWWLILQLKNK